MRAPDYHGRTQTGVVHFGPGAFHRAHQAHYFDLILQDDPRWGIAAVSLRSPGTVEALRAQQGLYTLAVLDEETSFRTVAVHDRFLGPGENAAVRALLSNAGVKIVSSTVTEKGYCLAADGSLDFNHPDIADDLANPSEPISIIGWLALGLSDRRAAGLEPFTPLCCDNMVSNGKKLRAAVLAYLERVDAETAAWAAQRVSFPDTMVDSITPATDERLRSLVKEATGFEDRIPVSREAYTAWIIEDILPEGSPDFASAGAVLTKDFGAWERAKLRILNGAHSSLAYLGLLIGHSTVAEAMDDDVLSAFVERMVREDIIPSLEPTSLDLQRYADDILTRFRNPAIHHKLSQIAWDGSQKLPYRLLDTISDALSSGRSVERLAVPIAAWMLFVQRQARAGIEIVDPLNSALSEFGRSSDASQRLLDLRQIFPAPLAEDPGFREAVLGAARAIDDLGPTSFLSNMGARFA